MSMLDEKRIETLTMKVKDIKTGFGNPRKIGKKEAEELEESLEKYGDFGLFLIDEHDNVIAGNQRLSILQRKDGDIEVLCNANWNGSLGATGTILKRVLRNHCIV